MTSPDGPAIRGRRRSWGSRRGLLQSSGATGVTAFASTAAAFAPLAAPAVPDFFAVRADLGVLAGFEASAAPDSSASWACDGPAASCAVLASLASFVALVSWTVVAGRSSLIPRQLPCCRGTSSRRPAGPARPPRTWPRPPAPAAAHLVVRDAEPLHGSEVGPGLGVTTGDRVALYVTVIGGGVQGGLRHRVHGAGSDQLLHVQGVPECRGPFTPVDAHRGRWGLARAPARAVKRSPAKTFSYAS